MLTKPLFEIANSRVTRLARISSLSSACWFACECFSVSSKDRLAARHLYHCTITSTYLGSSSTKRARRPDRTAAIGVVSDPPNGSKTMSRLFEELRIARSTNSTGFIVNADARSAPPRREPRDRAIHHGAGQAKRVQRAKTGRGDSRKSRWCLARTFFTLARSPARLSTRKRKQPLACQRPEARKVGWVHGRPWGTACLSYDVG